MLAVSPMRFVRPLQPRPRQWYGRVVREAGPDAFAGVLVGGTWFLCTVLALWLVVNTGSKLPRADDWCNMGCLYKNFPEVLPDLWIQHCEHRIPLPRLIAWAVLPQVKYDWRSLMVVNVVLLSLTSLVLTRAVGAARGRTEWSDAFLPLTIVGLSHFENLLWGFQVQFTTSTCLAATALGCIMRINGTPTVRQGVGVGVCALVLPLCGANGLAFAAPLAVWLALAAWSARRAGSKSVVAFAAFALAVVALIGVYFVGYTRPDFHPPAGDRSRELRAFAQFLAMALGPVSADPQFRTADDWPLLWPVAAAVLAVGLVGFAVGRSRMGNLRWLGLGAYLAGCLALAVGVAHGRAGLSPDAGFAGRYVTLASPLLVWAYFAAGVGFAAPLARAAQVVLCLVGCVLLWPNTLTALTQASTTRWKYRDAEAEVRGGVPLPFLPDRLAPLVYAIGWDRGYLAESMDNMHARKMGLFAAARPAPPMGEIEIPIAVTQIGNGHREGAGYRFSRGDCYVSVALDQPRKLYGFRLEYDYLHTTGTASASTVLAGPTEFTHGARAGERPVLDPLTPGKGKSSLVWLDTTAAHIRFQFLAPDSYFEPRRLVLLVAP